MHSRHVHRFAIQGPAVLLGLACFFAGTGLLVTPLTGGELARTITRAAGLRADEEGWDRLVLAAMSVDSTWTSPGTRTLQLYASPGAPL